MHNPASTGYMGTADKPLFFCFDAPQRATTGATTRPFGFVLCPPFGREYVSTHRVFRQFASRLARAGFPVLRFDYFATGDSAGEDSEGSLEQWLDDVATAVDTFRNHTAGMPVWLAGLRVGASLAALYAAQHQDVGGLILWDAVVDGKRYGYTARSAPAALPPDGRARSDHPGSRWRARGFRRPPFPPPGKRPACHRPRHPAACSGSADTADEQQPASRSG